MESPLNTGPHTALAKDPPRIAILGLFGECNSFRQPIPEADYQWLAFLKGDEILTAVADDTVFLGPEVRGFFAKMDETGPWTPVPILIAESESGPPLEEPHLRTLIGEISARLRRAGPVDGVFIHGHGSVVAEETKDVDTVLLRAVRDIVGDRAKVVEILDPHGKVTPEMIALSDLLISYRTDPHVDMFARGEEAAVSLRRLLAGEAVSSAYVRLPIMIPTVAIVAPDAPFAPAVELAEKERSAAIANISILPSYPWTDTPFAGFHVLVSSWGSVDPARALALDLASYIWERRTGFLSEAMSVEAFAEEASRVCDHPGVPATCFADVADNPGGGATANTTYALEALLAAKVRHAALGPFHDPRVAGLAHKAGLGREINFEFNVDAEDVFARRFKATGVVTGLSPGVMRPRSGPAQGVQLDQGPSAAIQIDGVTVVVTTRRLQALAVEQFEIVGVDLSKVRVLVVKSRGHYQAAYAEFFAKDRMIAIDTPGWTTPNLWRLPYKHIHRPLYPMDRDVQWAPLVDVVKPAPS